MAPLLRSTVVLAAAGTTALVVMAGAPVAAGAATPTSAHGATVKQMCSDPKPGYAACFALKRTDAGAQPDAATPNATPSGYGPTSLISAYNIPTTLGAGKTVAIVDAYNDPTVEADLGTYRTQYGLSACTTANGCFKKVSQTGSTTSLPATNTGWSGEIALDVEMVSASCPLCNILLVEASSASNANLDVAENYAAAHASVVSNSFGGSESSSDTSDSSYTHSGVPILASSGDEGYVVEFPASSPSVIAVGGTALKTASNSRGWTESVWNTSNSEGAGSGCSKYETQPSWQASNTTIKAACSKKAVADVSAVADPATGVAVYDTTGGSGWAVYGGTSVASPLVSGIVAESGSTTNNASYGYSHTGGFFDVTSGQTASSCTSVLCKAGTGWDGPTGLGTPNGTSGFGAGGGTTPPPSNDFSVSASPASGSVTAGSSATATISTAVTSGSAVSVALAASGAPSGVTATLSPTSVTAGGSSTLTLATTSATAAGTYQITVTGTSGSTTHTATYSLTVTAAGGGSCSVSIANGGFESGSTGWTATSGVINTDGAHAHAGSGYAWLDGYGSTHTDTLSQSVTVPSGCTSASVTFYLSITTAETTTSTAYDKLTVAFGSTTLASYSNLNKSSGYVAKTLTLPASAIGTTSALKFTGAEDSSLQTSFFLDDISAAGH